MAITVIGTGPYQFSSLGIGATTSTATYSYFSGLITTTDSFEDNILDFGVGLAEIWIMNFGSNAIAFQFPDKYITTSPATPANTASGIVLPADKIYYRRANKKGMKLRSALSGAQSTLYVHGI